MKKDFNDDGLINFYDSLELFIPARYLDLGSTFVNLLTNFEGVKYKAYKDSVGVWTIGVGFIDGVCEGMTMTPEEVENRLLREVERFEDVVSNHVHVPVTQYQFDSMVSLAYNVGVGGFQGSSVVERINNKDYEGAADAFLMWNKGTINGKLTVIDGLTRRRHAERDMFLTGDWEHWNDSNWRDYL